MINVTKTFLPPYTEFQDILEKAWKLGWITNRGALVKELEDKLKMHLGVSHILATTNGTLPIQIAIKALGLTGEIITTPFSYVATTSGIVWEGCTPVFVDIHPEYFTIDETKIEAAITDRTSAILATHVYGNPCAVDAIAKIAKTHNLKVIYDAAHCFDVTYKGQSLFNYGDVSTCSFHATKLFHTGEGGALFCRFKELYERLYYHHNFGHKGQEEFQGLGINAKMSELQAAMGLAILPHMNKILTSRKAVVENYNRALDSADLQFIKIRSNTKWNYSYYPIVFNTENQLLKVLNELNNNNIFPRRYFYPSLDTLPYIRQQHCKVSRFIASRVLCLPLFHDLTKNQQIKITSIIKNVL